jgi:signal transduction histidine kinase
VSERAPAARLLSIPRGLVRSLSGQLALLACVTVAPVVAGLIVLSTLMVISDHAVVLVSAILIAAALLAIAGAWVFSRALGSDLDAIRDGLEAVGAGERRLRITTAANDELARVAEAANAMIDQLVTEERARDASDSARRHLIAAVSHDLRTPLTSLRLLADAVGDDIVSGMRRRQYLDRMRGQIDTLGALIDDLFELSRLEAGDIGWSLEQVPLAGLVDETLAAMRPVADAKRVTVSASLSDRLAPARANPEKLQRVLFNLIQNAIRHTPPDGSVVVRAEPADTGVEIEVADTGDGIAPGERTRVFDAFYRGGGDAARSGDRSGLGLAVSRAIVEAHGGRIWIADSARGARVRFNLPVAGDGQPVSTFDTLPVTVSTATSAPLDKPNR